MFVSADHLRLRLQDDLPPTAHVRPGERNERNPWTIGLWRVAQRPRAMLGIGAGDSMSSTDFGDIIIPSVVVVGLIWMRLRR